jgi:hypothetical protein
MAVWEPLVEPVSVQELLVWLVEGMVHRATSTRLVHRAILVAAMAVNS